MAPRTKANQRRQRQKKKQQQRQQQSGQQLRVIQHPPSPPSKSQDKNHSGNNDSIHSYNYIAAPPSSSTTPRHDDDDESKFDGMASDGLETATNLDHGRNHPPDCDCLLRKLERGLFLPPSYNHNDEQEEQHQDGNDTASSRV